jgi:hypothetical protein
MWAVLDKMAGPLFDASIGALVLWSVVALGMLGSRQPARRLRLARAGAVAALVLWPLIGVGLVPKLDVVGTLHDVGVLPHPLFSGVRVPRAAQVTGLMPPPPAPTSNAVLWTTRGLTLTLLAGGVAGLGWVVLGCLALKRLTRHLAEPTPEALELYESLPYRAGARRPALRVVDRVSRPVLVGVLRPRVLIPSELERPELRDQLRLGLLHELAHAKAGDPKYGLLMHLARALWYWAPPLWWVSAQVRLDQEYLADRRAALLFGPRREYASSLLEFASTRAAAPSLAGSVVRAKSITGSPLYQRVSMLLICPFPVEARPPTWWSWGVPCLASVFLLGLSSLSFRPPLTRFADSPLVHTYQVSHLQTHPAPAGPLGRAPELELPIPLPDRFDLSCEVWGGASTISQTRVVGVRLGADPSQALSATATDDLSWHAVRIKRDASGVRLWVDGQATPLELNAPPLSVWLSVEAPPDTSVAFQRMTLIW